MRRKHGAPLLISIAALSLIAAGPAWSIGDEEAGRAFDILVDDLQGKVDVHTRGEADLVEIGSALDLPSRIVTGDDGEIQLRQGRTRVDGGDACATNARLGGVLRTALGITLGP